MTVSIAELNSRVFLGLKMVAEFLTLDDVHNQVQSKLNVRTMQSRMSDVNVLLGLSAEFTPDTSPYDVTELIGKGVVSWIETQADIVESVDWWRPIRIVSLEELSDYQRMGALAAAVYADEPDDETSQPTQYIAFSFMPNALCRIRFDRDGQRLDLDADMLLPDNLAELVILDTMLPVIKRVKLEIAARCRRDEVLGKIAPMLITQLDGLYDQIAKVDLPPLESLWEVWAFRDRDAQGSFNNPTPSGKGMYGRSPGY